MRRLGVDHDHDAARGADHHHEEELTPDGEEVAPSTTLATTTTEAAVGAATSTTGGGELPFTGATAGPMLIAGIALVAGGTLFLMVSRVRDRHATR